MIFRGRAPALNRPHRARPQPPSTAVPHTCFFEHLAEKSLHFVGSLPPSDHPGLRAVDATVDALGADPGNNPAEFRLACTMDEQARQELEAEPLGKRILVTDHQDWPVAEVVAAYRPQPAVVTGSPPVTNTKTVSFSPMFHWSEPKLRVHAFYCVLALAIAQLMRRQAGQSDST